jgi:hypothetical protein
VYCPQCGTPSAEGDAFCSQCRTPLYPGAPAAAPGPAAPPPISPAFQPPPTVVYPPPQQVTFVLPAERELAIKLMFWMGHALALLGWIFAIVWWVNAVRAGSSYYMENPFRGSMVMMGFFSLLTGHVLQIICFWASVILRTLGNIADKKTSP